MFETFDKSSNGLEIKKPSILLVVFGIPAVLFAMIFAGRVVWEETFLTWQQGPQMLGFSLAHGSGAVLFLAPLLLALWLLVALVSTTICLWRKRSLSAWHWSTLICAILVLGILSLPPTFWQWAFIGTFAKSPHAAELMVYGAAEGDVRSVRGYLEHGVPVAAKNYEGSNAAFAAAAGGSLRVMEMLISKGIDLNETNCYGDSPLEAAIENGHTDVVSFLKAHGALQVRGTQEQHEAAAHAIVSKQIERERGK